MNEVRPNASPYAALWVKSNYSFLEGASHPEELVTKAADNGLTALAITDRDGVYGVVRAHLEAKKRRVSLLLGAEVTVFPSLDRHRSTESDSSSASVVRSSVVLLAKNRNGWGSLTRLLSKGRLRSPKGESSVHLDELLTVHDCIALTSNPSLLAPFAEVFSDNAFGMVARHHLAEEIASEQQLRTAATLTGCRLVAVNEVLYHDASRRPSARRSDLYSSRMSSFGRRPTPTRQRGARTTLDRRDASALRR